jgi:hypothetical protein
MDLRRFEAGRANVDLSLDELRIVGNALNEVCNGLDIAEFSTRIGAEHDDALWLLQEVRDVLDAIEEPSDSGS